MGGMFGGSHTLQVDSVDGGAAEATIHKILTKLVFVTFQRFQSAVGNTCTCFAQVCFDMVKAHFETIRMFSKLFCRLGPEAP